MTDTAAFEVAEPILSSPFEEPPEHWWIEEGMLPERRPGRRPAGYFYRDPLAPPADDGFARGEWIELESVNRIRERLAQWRSEGYPGATRTTRRADRVLASGRTGVAALLRPTGGCGDRHLPPGGPLRLPPGHRCPPGGRRRVHPQRLQDGDRIRQDDGDGDARCVEHPQQIRSPRTMPDSRTSCS